MSESLVPREGDVTTEPHYANLDTLELVRKYRDACYYTRSLRTQEGRERWCGERDDMWAELEARLAPPREEAPPSAEDFVATMTEAERVEQYEDLRSRGLSDAEARGAAWPEGGAEYDATTTADLRESAALWRARAAHAHPADFRAWLLARAERLESLAASPPREGAGTAQREEWEVQRYREGGWFRVALAPSIASEAEGLAERDYLRREYGRLEDFRLVRRRIEETIVESTPSTPTPSRDV